MTASLNQSGSRGCGAAGAFTSREVVKVPLAAHMVPNAEDMARGVLRVEGDVIARAVPQVPRAGKQVVHLERLLRGHVNGAQVKFDPACLQVLRIEIDDDQKRLATFCVRLAVGKQRVVVDAMEFETAVGLQWRVVAAYAVHPGDEVAQIAGSLK